MAMVSHESIFLCVVLSLCGFGMAVSSGAGINRQIYFLLQVYDIT
jgi:hypothetical protein